MKRPNHIIDYVAQGETSCRWYRIAHWWPDEDAPGGVRGSASALFWHRHRGHGIGFQLGVNGSESDIGLDVYLGKLGSAWFRLAAPWTKRFRIDGDWQARHIGLRIRPHEMSWLSWDVMSRENERRRSDPWWMQGTINKHTLLGRQRSEQETIESGVAIVPMPEGGYTATWERVSNTTRYVGPLGKLRDRVFGPRRSQHISLHIEGGIPVEGKGENSWDCGMDGIFGTSGRTVEDAIANAVRAALRDRKRYGGPHNLTRPTTVSELA